MEPMRALSRPTHAAFFCSATLAILGACFAVRYTGMFASNPDVAAWGITFDLTISVPFFYWFFLVRTGRVRPLTIGPVFLLGTVAATALLPGMQQEFARQLARVIVPAAEVFLVFTLVRRLVVLKRQRGGSSDPYERISAAARTLVGEGRVVELVASEVTMVYYAFFGWRQRPEPRQRPISFHERNGWGSVVACILVLIAAEGLAMHLFLARWSSIAAWAWTALDVWTMIWLLGDYHALRLRRTWLDDQALHLQLGLRWSVTIPRNRILSVRAVQGESDWKRRDVLKVALLEEPRWLITLREVHVVRGLAGMRKEIIALALLPDDDEWIAELETTITPHRGARASCPSRPDTTMDVHGSGPAERDECTMAAARTACSISPVPDSA